MSLGYATYADRQVDALDYKSSFLPKRVILKGKMFIYRPIQQSDLMKIEKLAEQVKFDVGMATLELYFDLFGHNYWELAETENGEVVMFSMSNKMPNGMVFGALIVCHENYRGLGLTSNMQQQFWFVRGVKMAGAESGYSMVRYGESFQCFGPKLFTFTGHVEHEDIRQIAQPNETSNVVLVRLAPEHLPLMMSYDRNIIGFERTHFWPRYLFERDSNSNQPLAIGVIALNPQGTSCLGFAVARQFARYMCVSPLYADNDCIARRLFIQLMFHLPNNTYMEIPILSDCNDLVRQFFALGYKRNEPELRVHSLAAKPYYDTIDMEKVYCVQEFYPV